MKNPSTIDDKFSLKFYDKLIANWNADLTWFDVPIIKCPFDLQMYQEIISETKPELIIETGVFCGGTTLFFAHMLDLLGQGEVVGVELKSGYPLPEHPRITYMLGRSSTDPGVLSELAEKAKGKRTMVVLDSAHNRAHVLNELKTYHGFVTQGCYLIVEDTNVHGYRFAPEDHTDGGPAEAVKEWQPTNRGYEIDRRRERLLMSFNPGGYLRRIR